MEGAEVGVYGCSCEVSGGYVVGKRGREGGRESLQ